MADLITPFSYGTHLSFMRQNGKGYEKETMVVTGHDIKYQKEAMRNKR
jgi:hypothetical protein